MEPALTLANSPLDLQITICMFLHPSDILALRKTCKALELATRKRIVWVTVLHRVCLDNTLFLPSFPIPDMSNLELERAAMAPRRWIELCAAFQKQHSNDSSEMLHPQTTRIIENAADSFFIVPGGRYLLTAGNGIFVWDLGYVSTVDCKLVASAGLEDEFQYCMVQTTPDGKGLVILSSVYRPGHISIFEIYPQSEIPVLTRIARFDWYSWFSYPAHLLPDTMICHDFHEDRSVFRVMNYRTNYSTCLSADVSKKNVGLVQTFATKTTIMVFYKEGILIWAIPPLSPSLSDFPDHFLDNNPTLVPPLFKIPFPDGIIRHTHEIRDWMTLSSWYFGSESIYFDIYHTNSKLQRFEIIIKPDLSDASLHAIDMSGIVSDVLMKSLEAYGECEECRICEDALVYLYNNRGLILTSTPFTNVVTQCNGSINSFCPTSGRFVYCTDDDDGNFIRRIVVVDLF